jgi:metal-sulfur cluster biosynthetic enzyme
VIADAKASQTTAIAGEGPLDRRTTVLTEIDAIVDPCSRALGRPVGLVAMGVIERVDILANRVCVTVLPTFPTCIFRGVIEEEIEMRVRTISWCEEVSVRFAGADAIWDESRLSDAARRVLGRRPRAAATCASSGPASD